MEAVLLDTDVFSYLMKPGDSRGPLYRPRVTGKTIAVSFITFGELYYGALHKQWGPKNIADLESRLRSVVIVPYDQELSRTYGRLKAELRRLGKLCADNDLWIATCAVRHNVPLVTHNAKHFAHVPGLQVITEYKTAPAAPSPTPRSLFDKNP